MQSTELEKIFFVYCKTNPEYYQFVSPEYFNNPEIRQTYKLAKKFHERFKNPPTEEQLIGFIASLKAKGRDIKVLDNSTIHAIYTKDISQYEKKWLDEVNQAWIMIKNLETSIQEAAMYMKTTELHEGNVREVVEKVKDIVNNRNRLDFSFSLGSHFYDPLAHNQEDNMEIIPTGFDFIDDITDGGFATKTVNFFLGLPNVGKSIWLCNIASNAIDLGYNTCYVSLEMAENTIIKRVGANLLDVSIARYKEWSQNEAEVKSKLSNYRSGKSFVAGDFYAKQFPTGQLTVDQLEGYLQKLEQIKGKKFKVVCLDYINLLSAGFHDRDKNSYFKLKLLSEELRGMAIRNEWCVVTASQLKKDSAGRTELTMGDTAESSGMSHTADTMWGIIQTPDMLMSQIYWLQNLKNRDGGGKTTKGEFAINYDKMRIKDTGRKMNPNELMTSQPMNTTGVVGDNLPLDDVDTDILAGFDGFEL